MQHYLSCSVISCGNTSSGVEVLWASIACQSLSSPLTLGCFYRPPSLPTESVSEVCDSIESMMTTKKYVIACGDFNIDMADLSEPYSKLLHDFLTSHSLQQPINAPTRFSASSQSILDLFILSSDIPISESHVLDLPISDHLPILLDIHCKVPKPPPPSLVTRRSYKNFSKSDFEKDLSFVPWSILDIFDNPDDKVHIFNALFLDVLDMHAPLKTVRVKRNPAPWVTKSIRDEMDRRNSLYRVFKKYRSMVSWDAFKAQRNCVRSSTTQSQERILSSSNQEKCSPLIFVEHSKVCRCIILSSQQIVFV